MGCIHPLTPGTLRNSSIIRFNFTYVCYEVNDNNIMCVCIDMHVCTLCFLPNVITPSLATLSNLQINLLSNRMCIPVVLFVFPEIMMHVCMLSAWYAYMCAEICCMYWLIA